MVWTVTMKFRPVRIEEKPVIKIPKAVAITCVLDATVLIGGVKGPACIHASGHHCVEREQSSQVEDIPARQVQPRERQIPGADHERNQKVPQHRRNRRNKEEEDHYHAVHGEEFVVGLGLNQVSLGCNQLEPYHHRKRAPEEKEQRDGRQVKQCNALVVDREQPRFHTVIDIEISSWCHALKIHYPTLLGILSSVTE